MTDKPRWFQTTAIDYPNSRPHIGTAFEKLGADVQARYRRMEGYDVFFLMGNDENTVKVSKRAAELGQDTQAYCDDMARQFREVWDALDISYDDFIQTSQRAAQAVLPEVHPEGVRQRPHLQGQLRGLVLRRAARSSRATRSTTRTPASARTTRRRSSRRSEPCYFFALSTFQDRLLKHYEENPDFIQPESRRNEIVSLIKTEGLHDVNISPHGRGRGASACRSTRSSRSTSGSTPC